MPITYCSAPGAIYSAMTGHGVPAGLVQLQAVLPGGERCERYGENMSEHEARAEGVRQGALVAFRDTDSFVSLAAHKLCFYGEDAVRELAVREEVDPDQLIARARG